MQEIVPGVYLGPYSAAMNSKVRQLSLVINPLSLNIQMHILLTVLHIFLMLLVERIWLNINTFHVR